MLIIHFICFNPCGFDEVVGVYDGIYFEMTVDYMNQCYFFSSDNRLSDEQKAEVYRLFAKRDYELSEDFRYVE